MAKGISLSFDDKSGMPTIVAPKERIPLCLGNNECAHFEERWDDCGNGKGYNQFFCNLKKKSVFRLLDDDGRCPLSFWYMAPQTKGEKSSVKTIVVGLGDNGNKRGKKRSNSNSRDGRSKRKSRKVV